MSRWIDTYSQHQFKSTWADLGSRLEAIPAQQLSDTNARKEVARLKKIYDFVNNTLSMIDPEFVTSNQLQDIDSFSQGIRNEINNFISGNNHGHLQNANNQADNLLSVLNRIPIPVKVTGRKISDSISQYAQIVNDQIAILKKTVDDQIAAIIEISKKNQTDLLSQQQEINETVGMLETIQQTIQQQTATFNQQFSASEERRDVSFEKSKEDLANKIDRIIEEANVRYQALVKSLNESMAKKNEYMDRKFEDLATKAATALMVLQKYQDDAEGVLGVVVNTVQAGAYKTYANEERGIANFFRRSAIFLMLLGVSIIVGPEAWKIFSSIQTYSIDWHLILSRLPLSIVLFVPALYLTRESDKHRRNEFKNRQRELILRTIDPYLALLDSEKREALKVDIAKQIFTDTAVADTQSFSGDIGDILGQFANLVKQIRK